MESEAVSSVKIAIHLMVISTLIFTILLTVNIAKPYIFDMILGVVNVTEEEKAKQFDDYDQKWVSGTKVLRVLKLYENTGFGVVYGTKKTQSSGNYAVNFGGVFKESDTYAQGYRILNFTAWKTKSSGSDLFYTKDLKRNASGQPVRYENKAVTRHSSADLEYIPPDGRFYAELIKDISGETIGICFTQE